jgi:hypothetical protein
MSWRMGFDSSRADQLPPGPEMFSMFMGNAEDISHWIFINQTIFGLNAAEISFGIHSVDFFDFLWCTT